MLKQTEIGMIPKEWDLGILDELSENIFCGRDPLGGKESHSEEITQFHIIQSAPVFDGYLDAKKIGYISEELFLNFESVSLKQDDVLLNQLGDGVTFARSCVTPSDILPAMITRSVGCIRCIKEKLNPWFLNAYFILPKTKKYIESFNSGSSRRAIDGGKMRSFLIPLPSIKEQERIGNIYQKIQEKIEINKQLIETYEEISRTIFKHWFIDFEFPNEKNMPYKSSGGKITNSELGSYPENWSLKNLSDVTDLLFSGGTPNTKIDEYWNGTHTWLSSGETRNHFIINTIKKITEKGIENSSTRKAKNGDIVIASAGQGMTRGQTSLCLIDTYINQSIVALRKKSDVMSNYYLFFNLSSRYPELRMISDSHSIRGSLTIALMKNFKIIAPESKVLKSFDVIIEPMIKQIQSSLIENQTLLQIRDLILPKLVLGHIRIK